MATSARTTRTSLEGDGGDNGDYKVVCLASELRRLGRKRVELDERVVVLFYVKGKIYALDHFCYRMLNV